MDLLDQMVNQDNLDNLACEVKMDFLVLLDNVDKEDLLVLLVNLTTAENFETIDSRKESKTKSREETRKWRSGRPAGRATS